MHEDNPSNNFSHETSLIHTSLDLRSGESFNLSNLVVEIVKSDQINDKYGCHLVSRGLIEIIGSYYPHTMHDLIQSSECDFTILESFRNFQEVKALQLPLMVKL